MLTTIRGVAGILVIALGWLPAASAGDQPPPTTAGLAALQPGDSIQVTKPGLPPIKARLVEFSADGSALTVERKGERESLLLGEIETVSRLERRTWTKRAAKLAAVEWGVIGFLGGLSAESICPVAVSYPGDGASSSCPNWGSVIAAAVAYGGAAAVVGAATGAGFGSLTHETVPLRVWGVRPGENVRVHVSGARIRGTVVSSGGEPGSMWIEVRAKPGAEPQRFTLDSVDTLEFEGSRGARFRDGARLGAVQVGLVAAIGFTLECTGEYSYCDAGEVAAGMAGSVVLGGLLGGAIAALPTPWEKIEGADLSVSVAPARGGMALGLRVSWK